MIVASVFAGRAWECFRWKTKLNNVILDPKGIGSWLESIYDEPLQVIYSDRLAEGLIVGMDYALGILFTLAAISSILISTKLKTLKWILYLGTFGLALISFAMIYAKGFYVGLFFEHSIQMFSPILLVMTIGKLNLPRITGYMKVLIAITFLSHGLFAVGYYPVPGKFIDMIINATGMNQEAAISSLMVVGILDFLIAIFIFIPKLAKPTLVYTVAWGFATSFARLFSTFNSDFLGNWFEQNFFEFMVRLGHFILPLIVLLILIAKIDRFPFRQRKILE